MRFDINQYREHGDLSAEECVIRKSFKWKINDFLVEIQNQDNGLFHRLLMFNTDGRSMDWRVGVKLLGNKKILFELVQADRDKNDLRLISYNVSILDNKNIKHFTKSKTRNGYIIPKFFLNLDDLKGNASTLLPGGELTIIIEILMDSSEKQGLQTCQKSCLKADLNEAFTDMNHSDCVILVGDEKLDCHSFMLEARSPVFKAMLGSGFQEGLTKTIKIENFTPATIKDMLHFIYTDSTENLKSSPCELFKAADHYQIDLLKEVTSNLLIGELDNKTALEYLVLAETYNSINLKKAALAFTVKNIKALMETAEYEENAHEYPALFLEVTKAVVNQMAKKIEELDFDLFPAYLKT